MQKAAFSIVNYKFDKIFVDLSNFVDGTNIAIDFDPKGKFNSEDSTFELSFQIKLFHEPNLNDIYLSVNCIGTFNFINIEKFDEIPDYFYINSIAILFPYLRAYISLITTQANIPAIILPTYNLSFLEAKLRENTTAI